MAGWLDGFGQSMNKMEKKKFTFNRTKNLSWPEKKRRQKSVSSTYVKTARSSSTTILPGSVLCLRCPTSHNVFRTHSSPSLPCLPKNKNLQTKKIEIRILLNVFHLKLKTRKKDGEECTF